MALYAHHSANCSSLSAPRRPRENIIYLRQNSDHSLYFFFSRKKWSERKLWGALVESHFQSLRSNLCRRRCAWATWWVAWAGWGEECAPVGWAPRFTKRIKSGWIFPLFRILHRRPWPTHDAGSCANMRDRFVSPRSFGLSYFYCSRVHTFS